MENEKQVAPLPRDYDQASFTEMMPFRSKKIRVWRSPILWFVAITAVLNVLLFGFKSGVESGQSNGDKVQIFQLIVQGALFYMLSLALLLIHSYARSDKPVAFYILPCILVFLLLTDTVWSVIMIPGEALGGMRLMEGAESWPLRIWGGFTGPGLREELAKGAAALFGAALTVWPEKFQFLPRRLFNLLRVRGPLDGILLGAAAGCAFIFDETGGQYVNDQLSDFFKASNGNLDGAFGSAMMLLIPRVMNAWVGHVAWAVIFGYAIGLAIVRPRSGLQLVLGGWFVAALLHGLWDSHPPAHLYALIGIGLVGGVLAIACLVKARQLEGSLFGRAVETSGSIVVERPNPIFPSAPPTGAPPSPAIVQRAIVQPAIVQPAAAAPLPSAVPPTPTGLVLDVGGVCLPLRGGAEFHLGSNPALGGRGQGVMGQVTPHPTKPDVLGLKNTGITTWYAKLRDNSVQPVEAQRNLRLSPGITVDFGGGLVGLVIAG